MYKTLVDAQNAISKSQALIARSMELLAMLAGTLDQCRHSHDRHEAAIQALEHSREEAREQTRSRPSEPLPPATPRNTAGGTGADRSRLQPRTRPDSPR